MSALGHKQTFAPLLPYSQAPATPSEVGLHSSKPGRIYRLWHGFAEPRGHAHRYVAKNMN